MTRVERWEHRAEIPLTLLAVAFTIAYAWPVLVPSLARDLRTLFDVLAWTVWGAFALDLTARLYLADERGRYALRHWYDVALVVLPVFRPLRLLRLLALVRILDRSAASSVAGRALIYVSGATVLAVALGALSVLDAEQDAAGGNITTYGDAVWWACTTVTTVGYGDHFPVTGEGRIVAVALMLVGIALVGTVTASVASWMLARIETERASSRRDETAR